MSKTIFKPFWSYDVVKTEKWLSKMHSQGLALKSVNLKARLFKFERGEPGKMFYRIVHGKPSSSKLQDYSANKEFEQVCSSGKFHIIRTQNPSPEFIPSYNGFLDRNKKLKYIVGIILLFIVALRLPHTIVLIFVAFGFARGSLEISPADPTLLEQLGPIQTALQKAEIYLLPLIVILVAWLIYTYFKLRITNKQLEGLCGDSLDLSFTLPRDTVLTRAQIKALKLENKLIKKTRIAWIYAPDKTELWLTKMEEEGNNLVSMSRLGNSFYFIRGEPRKMKFHVDYQNKTDPSYFNLNKESGWKLFFTSLTRFQTFVVWGQEYTGSPPTFYSDKESKLKQARRLALTFSLSFFPICILYIVLLFSFFKTDFLNWFLIITFMILIFELGFFAFRTIFYYFRVKKTFD